MLAVAVVGLGVFTFTRPASQDGRDGRDGKSFGNSSSPSVIDGCMEVNGEMTCYNRSIARTATNTPCAFRSPAATSTLRFGAYKISSTSAATLVLDIGKATTPFATTTSLGSAAVAADAQGTYLASTTPSGVAAGQTILDAAWVFAPSTYFVVKVGGTAAGMAQTGGSCVAEWTVI